MGTAKFEHMRDYAVISLENPPLNALSHAVRIALLEHLDRAVDDAKVKAIIIAGSPRAFSAGADIREFDSPKIYAAPDLPTLVQVVERAPKPVIAAVSGVCIGGGLELAMAAHFRVARSDASIGLPEVRLGLLPGSGGTQRLPRLVGVERALNMILSGAPLSAGTFKNTLLFDELVDGNLLDGALAFTDRLVAEARPLRRVRDVDLSYPLHEAYFQFARNMIADADPTALAKRKCVDAVQSAVKRPFEVGLKDERAAFSHLLVTAEAGALRHAFLSQRAAAKIADVPEETPQRKIARVGIVGAGAMGIGISMTFLDALIPVTLVDSNREALDRGLAGLRLNYESMVKKGRVTEEGFARRSRLLSATLALEEVKDCDLIIEAVFEEMHVKEQIFRRLDSIMKPGAILATNTSTLDVNTIASFTKRPQDVVGMHFFNPANVMKLLEVVRGTATAKDVLATVMNLSKTIGKTAVVAGVCDGFIGNRMIDRYIEMACVLVDQGALPWQVDGVLERWGMAMGPFRVCDLAGNDIGWAIRKRRYRDVPGTRRLGLADRLCEAGRFGQKTGKGWYRYEEGIRKPSPDPEVTQMCVEYRKEHRITTRNFCDEEIVERCVYALINEGARIFEEGIAARASDIDVIYLTGYGFPILRGGPMWFADQVGLYNVARSMKRFAAAGDSFWQPAPLLTRLIAEGKALADQRAPVAARRSA